MDPEDVTGCFFREQALLLAASGYHIGVLVFKGVPIRSLRDCWLWPGRARVVVDHEVATWRVEHVSGVRGYERIVMPHVVASWFRRYIRLNGIPDVLHAHAAFPAGCYARRLSRTFHIPYVVTEHGTAYQRGTFSQKCLQKVRGIFADANMSIAVSTDLARFLNANVCPEKEFCVIPNPLSSRFEHSDIATIAGNRSETRCTFLNVGLTTPKKGQGILIQAFSKAFRGSDTRLCIIGDGVSLPDLQALASREGVGDQVIFKGRLPNRQVLHEMQTCDVVVVSSLCETFGVVLIEALACGKPVVSTACGGPEDIVNSANGYLVAPGSVDQLAQAMQRMHDDRHRFDPWRIREDCVARFGGQSVVRKLSQVYNAVLS
ncbi:MAG: hypothetical protein A2Y76_15565 [Planctomycetes bacterium RBG_13_60_9]|nr:MAG: hypothetical protein A2Y76_15565 [Planctomycetes bacterium RBG_13_60_9]